MCSEAPNEKPKTLMANTMKSLAMHPMWTSQVPIRKRLREAQKSHTVVRQRFNLTKIENMVKNTMLVKTVLGATTMATVAEKRTTMEETKKVKKNQIKKADTKVKIK